MEEKEFQLQIITPQKVVYNEKVLGVTAPGKEGCLGILAHHAPLLTSLKPGKVEIRTPDTLIKTVVNVQGGFLETSRNKVDILVDDAEIES